MTKMKEVKCPYCDALIQPYDIIIFCNNCNQQMGLSWLLDVTRQEKMIVVLDKLLEKLR